jgi:hypothetical protein
MTVQCPPQCMQVQKTVWWSATDRHVVEKLKISKSVQITQNAQK